MRITRPAVLLAVLGLSACQGDLSDIQQKKDAMLARALSAPAKLEVPALADVAVTPYQANALRSPFARPLPTYQIEEDKQPVADCIHPDPKRARQPLEMYPLDSLVMRGVIGSESALWALVDSGDGNLFRVREGNYMGLDHGRIGTIRANEVELTELVPDGTGCWQERQTTLALATE